MIVIGAGLSKTGTTSLHSALRQLGMRSIHHDRQRLNRVILGLDPSPRFDVYDDIEAVVDIPTAHFFRELLSCYPEAKCVLTIRDENEWWRSVQYHFNTEYPASEMNSADIRIAIRELVYSSARAEKELYISRYLRHNDLVRSSVSPERLLVMDITKGDGWDTLCPFLDRPVPSLAFPHHNQSRYAHPDASDAVTTQPRSGSIGAPSKTEVSASSAGRSCLRSVEM